MLKLLPHSSKSYLQHLDAIESITTASSARSGGRRAGLHDGRKPRGQAAAGGAAALNGNGGGKAGLKEPRNRGPSEHAGHAHP
jgi:hypothetical protein